MSDLAILIPTHGRSDRLERVVANASHPAATVYLIMEPDEARDVAGAVTLTRPEGFGKYTIAANYGYRRTREPLIFSAADDLNFHTGWFENARACLTGPTLTGQVLVVGTNDLGNAESMSGSGSTHHLVDRCYLDETGGVCDEGPGSFLYEGYDHNFNDTEFVQTAQHRGVWQHCPTAIVEHLHYLWGKAPIDETYHRSMRHVNHDDNLYRQRRAMFA